MENQTREHSSAEDLIGLGMALGQNQTLSFVAGRCSAAQAETIRRLRAEKFYKQVEEDWRDFCPKYLSMSSTHADKIIRLFDEFGAGYFELTQFTRISPDTYREIAPTVSNRVLGISGEQIELTVKNSRRIAAAVSEARRAHNTKPPQKLGLDERVEQLTELCNRVCQEFLAIPSDSARAFEGYRAALDKLYAAIAKMRKQFGY